MLDRLFDLRFVIGAFFTITGFLILIYSFVTGEDQTVNRGCSILFILFGVVMLLLSRKTDATDEVLEKNGEMNNTKPV